VRQQDAYRQAHLVTPRNIATKRRDCPGDRSTIMRTLTPIGVTVAEIHVTRQIDRITADLIPDKTHTSDAFVHSERNIK